VEERSPDEGHQEPSAAIRVVVGGLSRLVGIRLLYDQDRGAAFVKKKHDVIFLIIGFGIIFFGWYLEWLFIGP